MDVFEQIRASLIAGEEEAAAAHVRGALGEKIPPKDILEKGLIEGMNLVGERFKTHEIFLPDVLMAAKAMTAGMEVLKPLLVGDASASRGKVILGTVQGDLHDIGKNLVGIMLKGAGFEVLDLGRDVPPERYVETARREGAQVIGMSALLTTTMGVMQKTVDLLRREGLEGRVKVIVGGAPVTAEFARRIGAQAHGFDAASAVDRVRELTGK
jgi:5-methyltetrahydrofolate--homocysteine methyltransferase